MKDNIFKLPDEIRQKLREPMPKEALKQHPTKKYLTTIDTYHIIERLNDIFGLMGWTVEHEIVAQSDNEVVVCGCICLHEYGLCTPKTYGGMRGNSTNDLGEIFKGAVTSLIGKAASYLEIGIEIYKGMTDANGQLKQQPQPATKPTKEPAVGTIPDEKFSHDMLEKAKWSGTFYGNGDEVKLTTKDGKLRNYKLTPKQVESAKQYLTKAAFEVQKPLSKN